MDQARVTNRPTQAAPGGVAFFRRPVAPDLVPWVSQIVGYLEDGARLCGAVEMAPLVVPFIVSFGPGFDIALGRAPQPGETYESFTSGLYPGHVVMNSTGRSRCIQVDFTPLGAARFFRFPAAEIAARMVPLDAIADRGIDSFCDGLAQVGDWHGRLTFVETFVRSRLAAAPAPTPEIAFAWHALLNSGGSIRIATLADRIGWSRKHLVSRFTAEFGLSPKTIARMTRFNRALELTAGTTSALADIAAVGGYADQAHFTREFREFSATTPAAWRAAALQLT